MAIPEAQLTTWANIGAQETSKTTYATVKGALESTDAGYQGRNYDVFLQGSYGNDTNVWKESDVDVVIRLNSVFSYDNSSLPEAQKIAWRRRIHGRDLHPRALSTGCAEDSAESVRV